VTALLLHRKWLTNANKDKYLQVIHPQLRVQDWDELLQGIEPLHLPGIESIPVSEQVNIVPPPASRDPNQKKKPKPERNVGRKATPASFVAARKRKDNADKPKSGVKHARNPKRVRVEGEREGSDEDENVRERISFGKD
jgi:hypothetical protein